MAGVLWNSLRLEDLLVAVLTMLRCRTLCDGLSWSVRAVAFFKRPSRYRTTYKGVR